LELEAGSLKKSTKDRELEYKPTEESYILLGDTSYFISSLPLMNYVLPPDPVHDPRSVTSGTDAPFSPPLASHTLKITRHFIGLPSDRDLISVYSPINHHNTSQKVDRLRRELPHLVPFPGIHPNSAGNTGR
jgi:hypothetical protein